MKSFFSHGKPFVEQRDEPYQTPFDDRPFDSFDAALLLLRENRFLNNISDYASNTDTHVRL